MQNCFLIIQPSAVFLETHPPGKIYFIVKSPVLHILLVQICLDVYLIILPIEAVLLLQI